MAEDSPLSAMFTSIVELQAMTAGIMYQRIAQSAGFEYEWIAQSLRDLADIIEPEIEKTTKPQFTEGYIAMIRKFAKQFECGDESAPHLTLIEGGAGNDDGPKAA